MVLWIMCSILLLAPSGYQSVKDAFQARVVLQKFENTFKVAQTCAIVSQKESCIFFSEETNSIQFIVSGDATLNEVMKLPNAVRLHTTTQMVLSGESGAPKQFRKINFTVGKTQYVYSFQMGAAKYYVEELE